MTLLGDQVDDECAGPRARAFFESEGADALSHRELDEVARHHIRNGMIAHHA